MSRGMCTILASFVVLGLAACGGQDTGPGLTAPEDVAAAGEAADPYAAPEPAAPAEQAEPEILVLPGAPEETEDEVE